MKDDKITKKHFTDLMNDYKSGKIGVQPGHPKEVEIAIQSFLDMSVMLLEYPEIDSVPQEYVEKLLKTLSKYPQYNSLTMELIDILNDRKVN